MWLNRVELFNYHFVFDIDINGQHRYVYNLPLYKTAYSGRHIYPDNDKFYVITPEIYVQLITMKNKDKVKCQLFVEENIDVKLLANEKVDGFEYLADRQEYIGSESSALIQALVSKYYL